MPYKLAKSLCVMVFRNIEFELWLEEKRGLLFIDDKVTC